MAGLTRLHYCHLHSLLFVIFTSVTLTIHPCYSTSTHLPVNSFFKGIFVFGSSIVDNGNNNYLLTLAKVNYTPYGIDFPSGIATGRFTNGFNLADLITRRLNLPLIKPFLDPSITGDDIINGVNYGSGAAGILNSTGRVFGQVISLGQQVDNFEKVTLPKLMKLLGKPAEEALRRYLFLVVPSGNDYQANYFGGGSNPNVTLEAFTSNLISQFSNLIKRLYQSGGRNFLIINVNPIGCSPSERAGTPNNKCNETLNSAANLFNTQLKPLLDTIKHEHQGFEFVLVNSYKIILDIIRFPFLRGFRKVDVACCELGDARILCRRGGAVCRDRSEYVYYDAQHNTEAVSDVIASKGYTSPLQSEAYPINLRHLELFRSLTIT